LAFEPVARVAHRFRRITAVACALWLGKTGLLSFSFSLRFSENFGDLSMRAICGAIITAGAMIGLGLTAMAFGNRYGQTVGLERNTAGRIVQLHLYEMDRPLVFVLVFLTVMTLIGLGIAFLGLAYHHHRRHHEMLHFERLHSTTPSVP
jgi:hypothetical protein